MIKQTAKEFLIDNLNWLSETFPEIHIRYEIDTNYHIIEVVPISVFNNNEDYLKAEMFVENRFEEMFPNEEILFISEDSLTKIKNAEYEFGKDLISMDIGIETPVKLSGDYDSKFAGKMNYALAA